MVERSRIILSRLEGKQIQQVGKDLGVSIPTASLSGASDSRFGESGGCLTSRVPESRPMRRVVSQRNAGGSGTATALTHVLLG